MSKRIGGCSSILGPISHSDFHLSVNTFILRNSLRRQTSAKTPGDPRIVEISITKFYHVSMKNKVANYNEGSRENVC